MAADPSPTLPLASPTPATLLGSRHEALPAASLRRNAAWMLGGNTVYAGCQWAMLAVLAHVGTPAMVGQFVLALAVTTPVMAFFMLQLRVVQATDARRDYQFGDYLALRLATTAAALAVLVGIALAYGYRREAALVIVAAAISAGVDSLNDIVYGLLQQHEWMERIAQSLILKGAISLVALSTVVVATGSVFYGILAVAAVRGGILLCWDLRNAATLSGRVGGIGLRPRWRPRKLLAMAWLSLPLGITFMLIVLTINIPRYFVEHFGGEGWLGIYGALDYLGFAGTTVIMAVGESAVPRLAHYHASAQTAAFAILLAKLAAVGAAIGAAGVAVTLVAGRPLLAVLYGPMYAEHSNLLVWTMIAAALGYVAAMVGYGVTAARYFRIQIPLSLLAAAVTAVACWWLVPRAGLVGAALAAAATGVTQLLSRGAVIGCALSAPRAATLVWEGPQE